MTGVNPEVDSTYLSDITGKLPVTSISDFVRKTGYLESLPDNVQDAYKDAETAQDDQVHSYLCNVDKEVAKGKANNCAQSKAWADYNQKIAAANQPYILEFELISPFPFRHGQAGKGIAIPTPASRVGKGLRGVDGRFERVRPRQQRQRYHIQEVDTKLSQQELDEVDRFEKSVNGDAGRTVGQKALFYGADGKVLRGTGAIARETKEVGLSASSAILNQTIGAAAGAIPTPAKEATVANHPNKKRAGETSGNQLAGLGAIGLIGVALAALLPMHFVTSAITFINSLVTFMTTTRNAVHTYTAIADATLGLFGIRGATEGFKAVLAGMLDGAFGKENIKYAVNAFAQTLNPIAGAVKVVEKIQQARAGTNNRFDELGIQLGIVNNGMKDTGLIPPDSPYMRQSEAIDQFVKDRSKGEDGEAFSDNLSHITSEIKTGKEVSEELAQEKEENTKKQKKIDKDINDVSRLVDGTKTNVEIIQRGDL